MDYTEHKISVADSRDLSFIPERSVGLVVTSPPYPMIAMWDGLFRSMNQEIERALDDHEGKTAFTLMHNELDKTWEATYRLLIDGGFACINIGDATRKVGERFQLYSNHARILSKCSQIGFDILPVILWRKQTNAPNKFMGSGMLPAGAYVTLEHEYILILRKGPKREFKSTQEKENRYKSAFFWEERNKWFSDIWDFKGIKQSLNHKEARDRSAAFPFELAYRLVNMYSVKGDTVLDPFIGTGTTMFSAMASARNSIGVEIEESLLDVIRNESPFILNRLNEYLEERLEYHRRFVENYRKEKGDPKHRNEYHKFPVITSHEVKLSIDYVNSVESIDDYAFRVTYIHKPGD